ncbi:MAG: hypothetical protein QW548_00205 [Candidatus Aenigmatarchaeota archaeon]
MADEILDVYEFPEQDIRYYAEACAKVAGELKRVSPHSIVCPLRGGYPPTRIVTKLCDYNGRVHLLPTSAFVSGREDLVKEGFDRAFQDAKEEGVKAPRIAIIDTAISGTSLRKLNEELKREFPQFKKKYGDISIYMAKVWKAKSPNQLKGGRFRFDKYNSELPIYHATAFVRELLCEDRPELLGIDYPFSTDRDRKSSYAEPVCAKKQIRVKRDGSVTEYAPCPTTADTLVNIVCVYARKGV